MTPTRSHPLKKKNGEFFVVSAIANSAGPMKVLCLLFTSFQLLTGLKDIHQKLFSNNHMSNKGDEILSPLDSSNSFSLYIFVIVDSSNSEQFDDNKASHQAKMFSMEIFGPYRIKIELSVSMRTEFEFLSGRQNKSTLKFGERSNFRRITIFGGVNLEESYRPWFQTLQTLQEEAHDTLLSSLWWGRPIGSPRNRQQAFDPAEDASFTLPLSAKIASSKFGAFLKRHFAFE